MKYLDDLEETKKIESALAGKKYEYILAPEYRWNSWACPKDDGGKLDHNKTLDGDDMKDFVNNKLFLSNTDNASVSLRKLLLESCYLHTVLDLPGGAFQGAGVKTVVLFFEKGKPSRKVWFYQLNLDRNLGKGNPLNEADLAEFVELQKTKADIDNSWSVNVKDIDQTTFDLSVKNPNKNDAVILREPKEILEEMKKAVLKKAFNGEMSI